MNSDIAQGNWTEIKGKIKTKWAKFTDNDVEAFKGNLDQIVGKVQQTYGFAKEKAEKEFQDFKNSLSTATSSGTKDGFKEASQGSNKTSQDNQTSRDSSRDQGRDAREMNNEGQQNH